MSWEKWRNFFAFFCFLNMPSMAHADALVTEAGVVSTAIYGDSIAGITFTTPIVLVRYEKTLVGEWALAAGGRFTTDSRYKGFSLGVTYDARWLIAGGEAHSKEVIAEEGTIIERVSPWEMRFITELGRWSFAGILPSSAPGTGTRPRQVAVSADFSGVEIGLLVARQLGKKWAVTFSGGWSAGFAAKFGVQQTHAALGLELFGI